MNPRAKRTVRVAGLLALIVVGACGSDDDGSGTTADDSSVSGNVVAPANTIDNDALPASSELIVRLEDISRADATAVLVAEQVSDVALDDFPVAFVLDFDDDDIETRNTYRVAARVEADGDLIMISDTVIPVITNGAPTTDVEVPLVLVAAN